MSHPMPTLTVRLPPTLIERIDAHLAEEATKRTIAKPTRSDWVRHAIECKFAEIDARAEEKKKRATKRKPKSKETGKGFTAKTDELRDAYENAVDILLPPIKIVG